MFLLESKMYIYIYIYICVCVCVNIKNSTHNLLDHNLQLDGCLVTSSTVLGVVLKYLGVILDSNLSFENHVSHVTKNSEDISLAKQYI